MNERHVRRATTALAILGLVATVGCGTLGGEAKAQHGFVIGFDPAGCPVSKDSFGPPGSGCPGKPAADCRVVPHGKAVRFDRDPNASTGEYVIDLVPRSPFDDGTLKAASKNGTIKDKVTESSGPANDVFPFRVLAPAGSACPNHDPQIILN